jgi:Restriction Enzyme Adenine Methylase Associated
MRMPEAFKAAPRPVAAAKKKPPPGRLRARAVGITLKLLIDEGLLWPGENVLSVEYKGVVTLATLTNDGRIVAKCALPNRPSRCSHCEELKCCSGSFFCVSGGWKGGGGLST